MKSKKTNRKTGISEKLGVATEGPLTKAKCLMKVRILRKKLKAGRLKGALRSYAIYYANWYQWRSTHSRKAA